jgi:hypothetical protein
MPASDSKLLLLLALVLDSCAVLACAGLKGGVRSITLPPDRLSKSCGCWWLVAGSQHRPRTRPAAARNVHANQVLADRPNQVGACSLKHVLTLQISKLLS